MWHYGEEAIHAIYHLPKFGGHRHCGSEDVLILVCHVISQDHVIKDDVTLNGRSPSRYVTIM